MLEGTPPRMLVVTAHLASGWGAIEGVMNELLAVAPGASWEYANVYDVVDGKTPLNWWAYAMRCQAVKSITH